MLIIELVFVPFAAGYDKGGSSMNKELKRIIMKLDNLKDIEVNNYISILIYKIKKAG
jgi:hypothetical protein